MADIAVVIVNYNTAKLAIEAVESVLEHEHPEHRIFVHLVDNASPGGDGVHMRKVHTERDWGTRVILHLETENHGFGRGNNVVLDSLAKSDKPPEKVFFLNPDARLRTDTIDRLSRFLDEHPSVGVVGCGILRPDGTAMPAAFRFPSARSEFATGAQFGPVTRLLEEYTVALPAGQPTKRVDWVSGAAFMARFDILREIGFFDPAFFLYYEEIDLMKRISERGWEIWHVADAEVVHEAGAATGVQNARTRSGRLPSYWYESWRIYFVNRHGRGGAGLVALSRMGGWTLHIVSSVLRGKSSQAPGHFPADFFRFVLKALATGQSR